jgi:hypothetical protein
MNHEKENPIIVAWEANYQHRAEFVREVLFGRYKTLLKKCMEKISEEDERCSNT